MSEKCPFIAPIGELLDHVEIREATISELRIAAWKCRGWKYRRELHRDRKSCTTPMIESELLVLSISLLTSYSVIPSRTERIIF